MICCAVPSSLGTDGLDSVCDDPDERVCDEGPSTSSEGSDRGITSMASEMDRLVLLFF